MSQPKEKLQIPNMPGVSLIAYYGNKPLQLQQLILDLQQQLQEKFPDIFFPYKLEQVHATIIGCEGIKTEKGIVNKWFYTLRNEIKYINYPGLLNYFKNSNLLPINIYFGGYQPEINYRFLSRNQHPSDRSFQLQVSQEGNLMPVIIGWPMKEQVINPEIDQIRRDLQQFNYLHKYHQFPTDIDNDLYLRLGTISGNFPADIIRKIQQEIKDYLQNLTPIKISLSQENLAIVKYQDLTLPLTDTEIYDLPALNSKDKLDRIEQLYK